jgi:hypothetical protein
VKRADKDYDIPVAVCPACKLPIHESMISGRWLVSCNCKEALAIIRPVNKKIEDSWKVDGSMWK